MSYQERVMNRIGYILIFLMVNIAAFYYLWNSYNRDRSSLEEYHVSQLSHIYEGALTTYRLNARGVFDNIVMQPDVLELFRQFPTADETTFKRLHEELYTLLESRYLNMKKGLNVRQLHFHSPEGRSIIRMHRPNKYGDYLFEVRYSVKLANTKKIYVEGFEEGRIFNGYRYVYPVLDNGTHLGSVEISVSMNAIIKQLNHIFKNQTFYFMLDKNIVEEKVFDTEKSNYLPAVLNNDFLVDQEVRTLFDPTYETALRLLGTKQELSGKLHLHEPLVDSLSVAGRDVIATFLPVQNVENRPVAYLVAFETNSVCAARWNELLYQLFSVAVIIATAFGLLYYLMQRTRYAEKEKQKLDRLVAEKTEELKKVQEEKLQTYRDIVLALVNLTEERDTYTAGHTRRVAEYALLIAKEMGYDGSELERLHEAAILHDIGKIVTPDSVLLKPGRLNEREYDIIKEHVIVSASILQNINFHPDVIEIVKYHHERCDGSGYPYGITKKEIPMLARILAVADTFDAMTTNRIYKPRKNIPVAIKELNSLSGTQYDADVVAAATHVLEGVHIDLSVTQLPTNIIEQERLSHYFKDPLTNLYNIRYLHLLLEFGLNGKFYVCANIVGIKQFTRFNHEHGWEAGNRVLVDMAETLERMFGASMLFRIYGDDFVILSMEHVAVDAEALQQALSKVCHFEMELNLLHFDMFEPEERIAFKERLEKEIG